ncbi:intermembrane phospholipid transport protein YdbH family protein [Pseudomonas borbori]
MISRRSGLRLTGIVTLCLLLGLLGYTSWLRLLECHDIRQLSWQGASLSSAGIGLARLSLHQHSAAGIARIDLQQLQLSWRQFSLSPPFWQHIELQRLDLDWQSAPSPAPSAPSAAVEIAQVVENLAWLPRSLRIAELNAELPCASGRCTLLGDMQLLRDQAQPLTLDATLNLQHQQRQLNWHALLTGADDSLAVQLSLAVDQTLQLKLDTQLQRGADELSWRGELASASLSEAFMLQSWLRQWAPAADVGIPDAPSAGQLSARWALTLPGASLSSEHLGNASGQLAADIQLPEPWPIPGLGQAQGELNMAAHAIAGQWFIDRLHSDLHLQQLSGGWLKGLPPALHADSLRLRIQPGTPLAELPASLVGRSLPLAIQLTSQGPTELELKANLALANTPPWAAQIADGRLRASSAALALAGWKARQLQADLHVEGYLDREQLHLSLNKPSRLSAGELRNSDLRLEQLSASFAGLQLEVGYPAGSPYRLQLSGAHSLSTQRLSHPRLKPQAWRWQGQLAADLQQVKLDGQLSTDNDLLLHVQLLQHAVAGLTLQAQLPPLFLRAGNPLAQTLADWPALLDLNNGRLSADATLRQPPGGAPGFELALASEGVAGIYDRSLLKGLDGQLRASLKGQQLAVEFDEVRVGEINPGVPLGPLLLSGRYSAPLAQPAAGTLAIDQARLALIGGTVTLAPDSWDLKQLPLTVPLQVQGLSLEQLFILYPTEGLAGSGLLDGELPLRIGSDGVAINAGHLAARAPGGRLRFQSERIRALGRSNPAMQLVTQSLEDFHYSTLSSAVDYHQDGKLNLAMRLEGRNPAIEGGRPIHFNINLEEDIPTLLASLQLTDKVNEIITRRVQQRMLERNSAVPDAPGTPDAPSPN